MSFFKNNLFIAVIALIVIFGAGSYYLFRNDISSDSALESRGAEGGVEGELLSTLLQLKSLKIDPSVFSSAVFQSLRDFSLAIPDEPVGRPNPFAPVGQDKSSSTGTTTKKTMQ